MEHSASTDDHAPRDPRATAPATAPSCPTRPPRPRYRALAGGAGGASARSHRRRWSPALRLLLAALLVVLAVAWALGDPPLAQGPVLLTISQNHGVDLRDLYAAPLLLAATVVLLPRRGLRRR
ncbi:MAG: hypothetical protein M5T61_12775 [Acidimicrobiia bacterium]|nr:hypothetical protein [Acidimicrobiia bacterium]